ncbi:MAG: phospholipase [Rhodospirillales bacterium]|nr:MAG: phospholipase [Rhodospirillales bacterium]
MTIGEPGRQVEARLTLPGSTDRISFLLFLPAGYRPAPDPGWPLMIFLHGAGERGSDLSLVARHGPPRIAATRPDFPFVLASPQCPADAGWEAGRVLSLIDHLVAGLNVDPDRIVLTGLSLGGYGVWAVAAARPDGFAALLPVCGRGDPAIAPALRHLPAWLFHGEDDDVVPISGSRVMAEALRAAGASVRFTVFPGVGHDSWTETYATPEVYDWLLGQRRPDTRRDRGAQGAD